MQSSLKLGTSVIPNDVEKYDSDRYEIIPRRDVEIVSKPSDTQENFLARQGIKWSIAHSGTAYLSPFSMNWNHSSQVYTTLSLFKEFSHTISLSSCRIDAIAHDPYLAKLIESFGSKSLVMAIEGISERIRNYLQKSLTDEEQYVGLNHAIKAGFSGLKFYYIFTGRETEEDIKHFRSFLKVISELKKKHGREDLDVRFSFTPLLSTLGTPTQYHGSSIQKAVKLNDRPLLRLNREANRYGFHSRLSTSIPISDFSQIMEFSDRRYAPLISYASINGLQTKPRPSIYLLLEPEEVPKKGYRKIPKANRCQFSKRHFRVKSSTRLSFKKLYEFFNQDTLHAEMGEEELSEYICSLEGKECPKEILAFFPKSRQNRDLKGSIVYLDWSQGADFKHTYANGVQEYGSVVNFTMSQMASDKVKKLMPMFTCGQTFEDICAEKSGLVIMPGDHIKSHATRHLGWMFKTHVSNKAHIYDSYCFSSVLAECLKCGSCATSEEVNHVSGRNSEWEWGKDHYQKVLDTTKSKTAAYGIMVEVNVGLGPFSAMRTQWLSQAVNRALLLASDGELVDSFLYGRGSHTRSKYGQRDTDIKALTGGKVLFVKLFNEGVKVTNNKIAAWREKINQFSTEGWDITDIRLCSPELSLRNKGKYSLIEYTFDSRRHPEIDLAHAKQKIASFWGKGMSHWKKVPTGRGVLRGVTKKFDSSKVLALKAYMGANEFETKIRAFMDTTDNHPMSFICGLMGTPNKPIYSGGLLGTGIEVLGSYDEPQEGASLFSDGGDSCPQCGGQQFINTMTGKRFGQEIGEGVCQICHTESF